MGTGSLPVRAQVPDPGQEQVASPAAPEIAPSKPSDVNSRIFGILPNYRTVDGNVAHPPLTLRQKLAIGYKDSTDLAGILSHRCIRRDLSGGESESYLWPGSQGVWQEICRVLWRSGHRQYGGGELPAYDIPRRSSLFSPWEWGSVRSQYDRIETDFRHSQGFRRQAILQNKEEATRLLKCPKHFRAHPNQDAPESLIGHLFNLHRASAWYSATAADREPRPCRSSRPALCLRGCTCRTRPEWPASWRPGRR